MDLGGDGKRMEADAAVVLTSHGENVQLSVAETASYQFKLDFSQSQPRISVSAAVMMTLLG